MKPSNKKSTPRIRKDKQEKNDANSLNGEILSFNAMDMDENKYVEADLVKSKKQGGTILKFSFEKPIYLQINRQNLFQYFITGLISPTLYEKNRPQFDIQSIFKEHLQLSNGFLNSPKDADALIELVFDKVEEKDFVVYASIAHISKPIPISRIKRVYVKSKREKDDVLAVASTSDAGIIPNYLIVSGFPDNIELVVHDEHIKPTEPHLDFSEKIEKYDRVLGAYAFLKNTSLLSSNRTNIYSNLSEHYLGFVRLLFNESRIPAGTSNKHQSFFKQLLGIRFQDENYILKWLFERASTGVNFTSADIISFGNVLIKNHTDPVFREEGREILMLLNDGIRRRTAPKAVLDIKHIDKVYLYIFSYLYLYGSRTSEDRTNSRVSLPNEVTPAYAELVFSLLGYFYGYSLLRNRDEKQNYTDAVIAKYSSYFDRPSIRFELTSLFDFYLIESIYQFVFSEVISSSAFSYIILNPFEEKPPFPAFLPSNYEFSQFELFGKQFYKLKKKFINDELIKKISYLPESIPVVSEIGLYCIRNNVKFRWNLNSLTLDNTEIGKIKEIAFIHKSDLIEHVNSSRCNYEELMQRIEVAIKYREQE